MRLVLGVDGGGTKTIARFMAASADGQLCVLATGMAGASNPGSVGWQAAVTAIQSAIDQSRTQAESAGSIAAGTKIHAAVLAIAGCRHADASERMRQTFSARSIADRVEVVSDAAAPLTAHLPMGESAIAVIAGTGSVASARLPDGSLTTVGGWGYLLDDAGSGFGIGREALRFAANQLDHGKTSDCLTEAALQYAKAIDLAGLKSAIYEASDPRNWIASFAPEVLRLHAIDQAAATEVVEKHADALQNLVLAAQKLLPDAGRRPVPVVLAGGLLEKSYRYRRLLIDRLIGHNWPVEKISLAPDAASNCGLLACRDLPEGP